MKQISVDIDTRNVSTKVKVDNRLQWYDPLKKEMQYFSGGQLEFKYVRDDYLVGMSSDKKTKLRINSDYRMLPEVVDMKIVKYVDTTNESRLRELHKKFVLINGAGVEILSSDNKNITFSVPDEYNEDFIEQLERNSFRFE